jgi:DNA-directed RNA polymerase beta subunit
LSCAAEFFLTPLVTHTEPKLLPDLNHHDNKRMELAGEIFAQLLDDLFVRMNNEIRNQAFCYLSKSNQMNLTDFAKQIRSDYITSAIE